MKGKKAPKKVFFTMSLRIDEKLSEKVKASADLAKRSMNKEIELILEERYS